jgi:hypothetical protein
LKASTKIAKESDEPLTKNPIIGLAGCCARAVSVQATALPTSVMNVRRLIVVAAAVAQHRSSYRFELSLKGAELPQRPLWVISEQALRSPNPTVNSGLDRSLRRLSGLCRIFCGCELVHIKFATLRIFSKLGRQIFVSAPCEECSPLPRCAG